MQNSNPFPQVHSFQDLISIPFEGEMNAACWKRELVGDFSEIIEKIELKGRNMATVEPDDLLKLQLSAEGQIAQEMLLNDWKLLEDYGGAPVLNVIKLYEIDDSYPFFPTDVYSFHVDRSPIPVDTFLCTYSGDSSEILLNSQAEQKVMVPEIREELKKLHHGSNDDFETFLSEYFFDLHYQAKPQASPIHLGLGHIWRLATDHPGNKSLPCVHRAPKETSGQSRLLLIC